jgi:hypothetical protein
MVAHSLLKAIPELGAANTNATEDITQKLCCILEVLPGGYVIEWLQSNSSPVRGNAFRDVEPVRGSSCRPGKYVIYVGRDGLLIGCG